MAHTILVRLDVDDEYADIHPDITATDYLEGSKAYSWEVVAERVFTESEVRAMADEVIDAAKEECNTVYRSDEEAEAEMSAKLGRIFARHGLSDPA